MVFAYAIDQFALLTAGLINTKALVASKVTKMKMSVINIARMFIIAVPKLKLKTLKTPY